jgi:hypothetical protein
MRSLCWGVLAAFLLGCGGTTASPDVVDDLARADDVVAEVASEVLLEDALEVTEEVADDVAELPDPTFVNEEKNHPGTLPDGPWEVDRTEQVRTTDLLPDLDVTAVAAIGDAVLAATPSGFFVRRGDDPAFAAEELLLGPCAGLFLTSTDDGVTATCALDDCAAAIYLLDETLEVADGLTAGDCDPPLATFTDAFRCDEAVWMVWDGKLLGHAYVVITMKPDAVAATCVAGEPWVANAAGIQRLEGGPWKGEWLPVCNADQCGGMTLMAAGPAGIWAAGGQRVLRLDESGVVEEFTVGLGGLPYDHYTALAPSPDGTKLAIGHDIGVTLLHLDSGRVEYFHSGRWLPGDEVRGLSWDGDGGLWVATSAGLARLSKEEIYLQTKAELLLDKMEQWFFRLDGFLTAGANFDDPWEDDTSTLWDDDNDGQWTEEGVGALCYAYAVTGDERYYEAAQRCARNMMLLIDIPAVSFEEVGMPRGFISRSVVRDDEGPVFASKATQSNWHLVHWTDGHDYYWKDDTSSDELTGHFFGLPLYYDLCAKDDEERAEIAEHVTVLADYLLDHGYTLPDLDGEPTTHGDWRPERLTMALDGLPACMDAGHELVDCVDSWGGGAFLDSVEVLGFFAAAWHVSGELRFLEAFEYLAGPARVGESAMFTENVATWTGRGTANYCDHELADLAFLTLLRYDPDPDRRQQWIASMLAAFEYEKGERNPLKSLSMIAFLPEIEGLEEGVRSLVEYPDDLRMWRVDNSHRLDVEPDVNDRHGDPQFKTALPYDELPILRWDHNPYGMAGGGDGSSRMSPAFWLLPYWGMRYHQAITVPGTEQE